MTVRTHALVVVASLLLALPLVACLPEKGTNPTPADVLDSPGLLGAATGSQNYIHTFASKGTYPYHCEYHTTTNHWEGGSVTVADGGPDSVFVSISQGAFHPASATVRPGGQVRWQNFDDGIHHTVTSD